MSVPLPPHRRLPRSLYLHIPFCHRRCFYCDFPVVPLGDRADGSHSASVAHYLKQLQQDLAAAPAGPPLSTLYVGGGTPSILSPAQLGALLDQVRGHWGLAPGAEVTLEMDPASFDRARLEAVLALGVNRVSLGGQSFNDGVLAGLGRRHNAQQLREACGWLRAACSSRGLASWSLDLIVNLPNQSAADWRQELEAALAEAAPHLSIYDLIVEAGTVFERRQRQGTLALPEEEAAAERLAFTHQQLAAAGYGHYEISSWALPGHSSRHNRVYWSGASWWACGLGSTAGVNGQRLARPRTREAYAAWLQQRAGAQSEGPAAGAPAAVGALPPLDDLLLVGLRRREGVNLAWLEASGAWPHPQPLAEALAAPLAPWLQRGLVRLEGQQLRLVPPEGFSLSNAVLRDLLAWWEQQDLGLGPGDPPAAPAPSPAGPR
jgi:oxygen-independent coproporphyrinogen-3 oxidase